jgi:hypothetical protein
MKLESMSLDDVKFEIAKRDLAIRCLTDWSPRMDAIEAEKQIFEEELRRRTSIFVDRGFKGGV